MRRVRWYIDRLTCPYHLLLAAKGSLNFALKDAESFFEVVTVRRRPATRGYVHVNQAELSSRVFAAQQYGVCISNHSDMRELLIGLRLCNRKIALRIVRRDR